MQNLQLKPQDHEPVSCDLENKKGSEVIAEEVAKSERDYYFSKLKDIDHLLDVSSKSST